MKNLGKVLSLIIVLAVMVCGLTLITASAEESNAPEIVSQNIFFEEKCAIMYAVSVPAGATDEYIKSISVKVYADEECTELLCEDKTGEIDEEKYGTSHLVFFGYGTAAQYLDTQYYARVCVNGVEGNVFRYSVLEYCLERLNVSENVTGVQKALYNSLIAYAGCAQEALLTAKGIECTPVADYAYVTVEGGIIDDGYTTGIYASDIEISTDLEPEEGYNLGATVGTTFIKIVDGSCTVEFGELNAGKLNTIVCANLKDNSEKPVELLATFELGADDTDGSTAHKDGSTAKTSYSETDGDYTLNITGGDKMYPASIDDKGNGCIKFGTSSVVGKCQFTVADNVQKVIIHIGKYKANTSKVKINGTDYTLTKNSNSGEYDAIVVDTSVVKTVSIETVSGGVRAMMNTIEFHGFAK